MRNVSLDSGQIILNLVIIVITFFVAAFFVACEFALVQTRPSALEEEQKNVINRQNGSQLLCTWSATLTSIFQPPKWGSR